MTRRPDVKRAEVRRANEQKCRSEKEQKGSSARGQKSKRAKRIQGFKWSSERYKAMKEAEPRIRGNTKQSLRENK
jgi:hypothetical protein